MSVQPGDIVGVITPKTRGNGARSRLSLRFDWHHKMVHRATTT